MNPRDVLEEATGRSRCTRVPSAARRRGATSLAAAGGGRAAGGAASAQRRCKRSQEVRRADVLLRAPGAGRPSSPRRRRAAGGRSQQEGGQPGPVTGDGEPGRPGAATRRAHVTQLVVQLVATPGPTTAGADLLELRSDMSNAVGDSAKSTASHWSATVGPAPRRDGRRHAAAHVRRRAARRRRRRRPQTRTRFERSGYISMCFLSNVLAHLARRHRSTPRPALPWRPPASASSTSLSSNCRSASTSASVGAAAAGCALNSVARATTARRRAWQCVVLNRFLAAEASARHES